MASFSEFYILEIAVAGQGSFLTSAEEHSRSCEKRGDCTFFIECAAVSMIDTLALLELSGEREECTESTTNASTSKNRSPNRIQRVQKDVPDES